MNIVGPPLGKVSIVPDDYPEWNINQAVAIFRSVPGLQRQFVATLLMADDVLRWAMSKAKATAGQFNLTLEICRDIPIPLPPEEEQIRIVTTADRQITTLENAHATVNVELRRAMRLRESVLARAFAGGLVDQDLSDEPASFLLARIRAEPAAKAKPPARPNREEPVHA